MISSSVLNLLHNKLQIHTTDQHTFSRMTNGPFTPPIVLYLNRGLMDIIRGSRAAGAMMSGSCIAQSQPWVFSSKERENQGPNSSFTVQLTLLQWVEIERIGV